MATNTGAPRLEVEIGAITTDLKKGLSEARAELRKFSKEAQSIGIKPAVSANISELDKQRVATEAARTAAVKFSSDLKSSLSESLNNAKIRTEGAKQATEDYRQALSRSVVDINKQKAATEANRSALEKQRAATEAERTSMSAARAELARLTLEKKKNQVATKATSGSYREAQQRLTALGKSIRETAGGFNSATPALRGQIAEYNRLNGALKKFDAQMGNHYRNVGNYSSAISMLSPQLSLLASGGGGFLAVALGAKSAYDTVSTFDKGLRSVEKTTGLSREETNKLGEEFVKLSKNLQTVSANSLTQYASIAGQLGVKGTQNILAFTEALAKLETASDITGESGGADIARLLTLTDGGVQNVKQFSNEIVNLGNNFAATEQEILGNATRIAQSTGVYRLGRESVLAYATATKSIGVEAELVGSSIGRTLGILEKLSRGAKGTDIILKLLNTTQADLQKRFKENSSGVLTDFIGALNKVDKEGGSVIGTLESLGIRAIRDKSTLGSLATNGFNVLTDAINKTREAGNALDDEFETASTGISKQVGRIKVAWENLILSIEQGTGIIGKVSVAFADVSANVLDSLSSIVTSNSWKEFFARLGELSGNRTLSIAAGAAADAIRNPNAKPRTVLERAVAKSTQTFAGASNEEKLLRIRKEEAALQSRIFEYQQKSTKDNFERLKYSNAVLAETNRLYYSQLDVKKEIKTVDPDPDPDTGSKKTPISELLGELSGVGSSTYDAKIAKINNEYTKLVKKINEATGERSDIAKALNLAGAKRDFEILQVQVDKMLASVKGIKPTLGSRALSPTGALSSMPTSLDLGKNPFKKVTSVFDDEFSKAMKSTLRRSVSDILNDLVGSLSTLGDKTYEIEKRYSDLRLEASASQIADLNKMEKLEKKINNGFTNILNNLSQTFTGIGGSIITSAVSTGISSGNFGDLSKLFQGKNKAMGFGALGSLAGGLIQGTTSKRSVAGQGLGGALAGAGTGAAIGSVVPVIGTAIGAVAGAIIGGLGGIFGASKANKQYELEQLQLAEQRKQTALMERQAALAYASSVIGQMTNAGLVTNVDRDAYGNLVATLKGKDIELALQRTQNGRG